MKVIAIVGPFRAATGWEIELNCRNAEMIALSVWEMGAAALCPHMNTRGWHGVLPDHVWLDGYLEMLRRCDGVVLIQGWEESEGSRAEVEQAHRLGLPLFETLGALSRWLEEDD